MNPDHLAVDVVKRGGKRTGERFDPSKLHASLVASILSVRSPEGLAQDTASSVTDAVIVWIANKPEVTSDDIRRVACETLAKYHEDAAYVYKHHKTIM